MMTLCYLMSVFYLSKLNNLQCVFEDLNNQLYTVTVLSVWSLHQCCKQQSVQRWIEKVIKSIFILSVNINSNTLFIFFSLWLINSVDDKKICVKDYIFVRCNNNSNNEKSEMKSSKIVKIKKVYFNSQL